MTLSMCSGKSVVWIAFKCSRRVASHIVGVSLGMLLGLYMSAFKVRGLYQVVCFKF